MTRKLHGELLIQGIPFECRVHGAYADRDDLGTSSAGLQVMTFAGDLPCSCFERTIIHEILEMLKHLQRLKLSHDDIDRLDASLWEALTSNGVDLSPLRNRVLGKWNAVR